MMRMIKIGVLSVSSLMLSSCSLNPLSSVQQLLTPETGITAQVGKINSKQLLGGSVSRETKQRDVAGDVDNATLKKGANIKNAGSVSIPASSIPIGTLTANKVVVNNGSVWPVVTMFLVGGASVLLFLYMLLGVPLRRYLGGIRDKGEG